MRALFHPQRAHGRDAGDARRALGDEQKEQQKRHKQQGQRDFKRKTHMHEQPCGGHHASRQRIGQQVGRRKPRQQRQRGAATVQRKIRAADGEGRQADRLEHSQIMTVLTDGGRQPMPHHHGTDDEKQRRKGQHKSREDVFQQQHIAEDGILAVCKGGIGGKVRIRVQRTAELGLRQRASLPLTDVKHGAGMGEHVVIRRAFKHAGHRLPVALRDQKGLHIDHGAAHEGVLKVASDGQGI